MAKEEHAASNCQARPDLVRPMNTTQNNLGVTANHAALTSLSQANLPLLITAIEQAGEAIMITDAGARIQYVNPAFTRITGYLAHEAIGQKPNILKSERQNPEYYRDLWVTITAGNIWRGELINRRKDGTYYAEKMTITPVRNSDNAITSYIAIKEDVTDRRAAEEALRNQEHEARKHMAEIEQIYKHAPVGLAFVDREYRVLRINERLAANSGLTAEQAVGRRLADLVPNLAPQLVEIWRQVCERGKPIEPRQLVEVLPKWLKLPAQREPLGLADSDAQPVLEVFREKELVGRLSGDQALARTIVAGFLSDAPGQLQKLKQLIEQGNAKAASAQAHTLKGAAATVSAPGLRELTIQIQQAVTDGELSRAAALLGPLDKEFGRLAATLSQSGWA